MLLFSILGMGARSFELGKFTVFKDSFKKIHPYLSIWDFFIINWEYRYFFALGMGPNFGPK